MSAERPISRSILEGSFAACFDELLKYASRLASNNYHDAEDIVQDAFLRASLTDRRIAESEHARKYLFRTVRSVAVDHYRKSERFVRLLEEIAAHKESGARDTSQETDLHSPEIVERALRRSMTDQLLATLDELRAHEWKNEPAARHMGMTPHYFRRTRSRMLESYSGICDQEANARKRIARLKIYGDASYNDLNFHLSLGKRAHSITNNYYSTDTVEAHAALSECSLSTHYDALTQALKTTRVPEYIAFFLTFNFPGPYQSLDQIMFIWSHTMRGCESMILKSFPLVEPANYALFSVRRALQAIEAIPQQDRVGFARMTSWLKGFEALLAQAFHAPTQEFLADPANARVADNGFRSDLVDVVYEWTKIFRRDAIAVTQ